MKTIAIYFVIGLFLVSVTFIICKILLSKMEKERKKAEEIVRMDNRDELLEKMKKDSSKSAIKYLLLFFLGLSFISILITMIILLVEKYL